MIDKPSLSFFACPPARVFAVGLVLLLHVAASQAGETVILQFDKTLGSFPVSGLASDAAGDLYGTTTAGGAANCGVVFELTPGSGGKWTETVLYSFHGCEQVTETPRGTLVFDQEGNLYGVQQGFDSSGFVFQLIKGANGAWSYSIIHSFNSNEGLPNPDLTSDGAGNLYGTTQWEFGSINGEVFELSPQPDGSWTERVLYTFPAPNGMGLPYAGVTLDSKGNLYGPTFYGVRGSGGGGGGVYELSPQANGPWTLTVIHNGNYPTARLIFDSSGNLYGTTFQIGDGEVFELSPTSSGPWTETTIHSFTSGSDGAGPVGTLVFDSGGNLYGATYAGGLGCNQSLCGTVYKLAPQANGAWKETILHQFESATDGSEPQDGVFLDIFGNLYGTTSHGGGRYGYGTIYEITP
jgi:uncharacterized repeat protein (TIGR03803 family)